METSLVSEETRGRDTVESTMKNLSLEDTANANETEETFDVSTPAKMDAMLERCFALGANKVTDAELPIRCEAFYANFVLPSRPSGVTLDLKNSSFKKQTKLFSVMEKKVGLIKTKLVHKIENIVSIDRGHALLAKCGRRATRRKTLANPNPPSMSHCQPPRSIYRSDTGRPRCIARYSASKPSRTRIGCTRRLRLSPL